MLRVTTCLFLAAVLCPIGCDRPPPIDKEAPPGLIPVIRLPASDDDIVLPFVLQNRRQQSIKVALFRHGRALPTLAFLRAQLYKDGKPLPYDVVSEPAPLGKKNIYEIKSGEKLEIVIDIPYLRRTLEPGKNYELRATYELAPGSEGAAHWEKELGLTPMALEQSVWLIVEPKK